MGMHVTVEIVDSFVKQKDFDDIFHYFISVDEKFSPYKKTSEVSSIHDGNILPKNASNDMKEILALAEKTKQESHGYFDVYHEGKFDPSGIVKGWAILQAAKLLEKKGFTNFYVNAGGDVQVSGLNARQKPWTVGIQNPFTTKEIVKVISLSNKGIATSGTAIRGQHIYNPKENKPITDIVSLTVVGPNVLEADRFATAAFAMGNEGINFINSIPGLEGYMINKEGIATYTKGFVRFL